MTWPTMDIFAKARQLESNIARRLDRAARDFVRPSGSPDALEIAHAVVETVEAQIQSGGRGTRVFPFTHAAVSVVASSADARARFEAVFEAAPSLRERVAERLAAAGCRGTPPVITIEYVARAHKSWRQPDFDVRFSRVNEEPAASPAESTKARIELTVVRGAAERRTYSFGDSRIDIGRRREVRDGQHRLIRANDIAFGERTDAVNQTVSRQHAHIVYDEVKQTFRLRDDGSAQGTCVVRRGKTLTVPRGARGLRLQQGDEIVLGEARLRVRLP